MDEVCPVDSQQVSFSDGPSYSMLDLLEDFMELRGIPYARLDGSTTRPRRTLDIKLVCVNHSARYLPSPVLSVPTREIA
jgi:hypothetical protein